MPCAVLYVAVIQNSSLTISPQHTAAVLVIMHKNTRLFLVIMPKNRKMQKNS
jgi:hypothetical protein